MSSEAQEPVEKAAPGPRPHRCNARVEDLLQVCTAIPLRHFYRSELVCVETVDFDFIVRLSDPVVTPLTSDSWCRLYSHSNLVPKCAQRGETCGNASNLSQGSCTTHVQVVSQSRPLSCRHFYRRQEPTQPYLCVKDPDLYLNPTRMTYKR